MKKFFSTMLVGMLVAVAAVAGYANTFTFDQSEIAQFWGIDENSFDTKTNFYSQTMADNSVLFIPGLSKIGIGTDFASMSIGVNDTGSSVFAGNNLTGKATVAGLGASDLSGFDQFALNFSNANNSKWSVQLFLQTAGINNYQSAWTSLSPGDSATLALNLTGRLALDNITAIGFRIGSYMLGSSYDPNYNPLFPSESDDAHMKVSAIPEPATMLLLGTGLLGFIIRKRIAA